MFVEVDTHFDLSKWDTLHITIGGGDWMNNGELQKGSRWDEIAISLHDFLQGQPTVKGIYYKEYLSVHFISDGRIKFQLNNTGVRDMRYFSSRVELMHTETFNIFTNSILVFDLLGAMAAFGLFLFSIFGTKLITTENCVVLVAKLQRSLRFFFLAATIGLSSQVLRQWHTI